MSDYLPPRHSDADRLADAWRYALADADNASLFIQQAIRLHQVPDSRHTRTYIAAMADVAAYEERMTAAGIPFTRSNRS